MNCVQKTTVLLIFTFYLLHHLALSSANNENDSQNLRPETTTEMPPNAAVINDADDESVDSVLSSVPNASADEQLLVIALVNRFVQINERIIAPYKDIVELQTLEPVHKMLDLIKSVALNELLFQRRIDKYECRQDLQDRLQPNTDLVKQIFTQVLYSDSVQDGQDKITMTRMLMNEGLHSLKLLFTFAARLSASVGDNAGNLRAFLAAYSCLKNVTDSTDEIIFGFRIEPKVDLDGNTTLIRIGWKEHTEDQQRISKSNLKFLLQLAKEGLTAQDVVNVCQKIDTSVGRGGAMVGQDSLATTIFSTVADHFAASTNEIGQKMPPIQHWQKSIMLCALSTFGDNLLKRVVEHQNFRQYFEAIGTNLKGIFGTKIGIDKKVALLHKSLSDFRNKYCAAVEANITKKDAFKFHENFIHYGNAIFIEWNPWRELIHTIDNVRSKLITDGVFKNTFNYNAKEALEFKKVINSLEQKFVQQIGQENATNGGADQEKRYGLVDRVDFWQNSVHVSEKASTDVLNELEEMRAKFQQMADEFDLNEAGMM